MTPTTQPAEHTTESQKLSQPHSRLEIRKGGSGDWTHGDVITPLGIVAVYSEDGYSRFDFVNNGRLHMRTIRKGYTVRGLATLAYRFAKEVSALTPATDKQGATPAEGKAER